MRTDKPKVPGTPASLDVPDSGAEHPKAGLESPKSGPENPKPGPENPKTGPESPKRSPENPKSGPENPKRSPENPKPSPENPKPGSAADLRARSDRLAPGHPSSPVEADGTRKPAAPRLQDIALPEPLTDAEHAEHVKEVRDRLDKARVRGLATDEQHTIDRAREVWSEERDALHDSHHRRSLYAKAADVPCERRAIIAGGLGGAGKSTVLEEYAGIDRSQYLTINPDNIKEEMAEPWPDPCG